MAGTFSQTSTAALDVQIGGTPAAGPFGSLVSTAAAALDGTLNVAEVNGYGPTLGQTYPIMGFANSPGVSPRSTCPEAEETPISRSSRDPRTSRFRP